MQALESNRKCTARIGTFIPPTAEYSTCSAALS